jgi:hypothetical protein
MLFAKHAASGFHLSPFGGTATVVSASDDVSTFRGEGWPAALAWPLAGDVSTFRGEGLRGVRSVLACGAEVSLFGGERLRGACPPGVVGGAPEALFWLVIVASLERGNCRAG